MENIPNKSIDTRKRKSDIEETDFMFPSTPIGPITIQARDIHEAKNKLDAIIKTK